MGLFYCRLYIGTTRNYFCLLSAESPLDINRTVDNRPPFTNLPGWPIRHIGRYPFFSPAYITISKPSGKRLLYMANAASMLLVLQVLFMRYNVVVGGQFISKSDRGFAEFHWEFLAREGILPAMMLLSAPFVTYYFISRFFPVLGNKTQEGG